MNAEEIEMKLEKVDVLEKDIAYLKIEIELLKKRIKRLQDQKEDRK